MKYAQKQLKLRTVLRRLHVLVLLTVMVGCTPPPPDCIGENIEHEWGAWEDRVDGNGEIVMQVNARRVQTRRCKHCNLIQVGYHK